MKSLNAFFAIFCLSNLTLVAQSNELNTQNSLFLNEKSVEQSITVEVTGAVEYLEIVIRCSLTKGEVIVELFDPEGKRQGKFTVGSKENMGTPNGEKEQNETREDGKLEKIVMNPVNGIWKIKITPTKTKASIDVRGNQRYSK
jgi:hypothetical protein